jgi:hypothetical protein
MRQSDTEAISPDRAKQKTTTHRRTVLLVLSIARSIVFHIADEPPCGSLPSGTMVILLPCTVARVLGGLGCRPELAALTRGATSSGVGTGWAVLQTLRSTSALQTDPGRQPQRSDKSREVYLSHYACSVPQPRATGFSMTSSTQKSLHAIGPGQRGARVPGIQDRGQRSLACGSSRLLMMGRVRGRLDLHGERAEPVLFLNR